jgi:VanZ family protein
MKVFPNAGRMVRRWGPVILVMGVIFTFSSLPSSALPSLEGPLDLIVKKSGHLLIYAILAVSISRALRLSEVRQTAYYSWSFAVLYAITDEYHQMFVTGRGASGIDVGIDALGAALGLLILYYR